MFACLWFLRFSNTTVDFRLLLWTPKLIDMHGSDIYFFANESFTITIRKTI